MKLCIVLSCLITLGIATAPVATVAPCGGMDELRHRLDAIVNDMQEQKTELLETAAREKTLLEQIKEEQINTRATTELQNVIMNSIQEQMTELFQASAQDKALLEQIREEQINTRATRESQNVIVYAMQEQMTEFCQASAQDRALLEQIREEQINTRATTDELQNAIVNATQEQMTEIFQDSAQDKALLEQIREEQINTRATVEELQDQLEAMINASNSKEEFIEENCTCPTTKHEAPSAFASHCLDVYNRGDQISGVYTINAPDCKGEAIQVFCEMEADNGGPGWIVIQRRQDGSVSFNRTWSEYRQGFGDLSGEHWLGNRYLELITKSYIAYELRIDLWDWQYNHRFAHYSYVRIMDESNKYKLVLGTYSGDAGDSLTYHNNMFFSTPDVDNDSSSSHIAQQLKSGWWYKSCCHSGLNSPYHSSSHASTQQGIFWYHWHGWSYSLKKVQMKIRPGPL